MSLSFIDVNPNHNVKAVVIWLHGLGDTGHGFAPIVPELKLADSLGVRFVFPHAPVQPVTINNGMKMNSWYDIKSMDLDNRADEVGVRESADLVEALIKDEIAKGIPSQKIVLAGFSQGGVIALHLLGRLEHQLAGVMAMSTYMCAPQKLVDEKVAMNQQTPIIMMHGSQDEMVPMRIGVDAKNTLIDNGYNVKWFDYPMPHSVCPQQINQIGVWLTDILAD
jgi:phospholipase/carboxylesterase